MALLSHDGPAIIKGHSPSNSSKPSHSEQSQAKPSLTFRSALAAEVPQHEKNYCER